MVFNGVWPIAGRRPGGYHSISKGGDVMVLKLWRGSTCLRTIYNVVKVNQDEAGIITVTNKVDSHLNFKAYRFPKEYERFEVAVD